MTETLNSSPADAPQHATANGEVALDGLCVIGRLTRIQRRGETSDFEGFLTAFITTSKADVKVELKKSATGALGDSVSLPAYDKLKAGDANGRLWCISVAATRGGANNQYTNLTAIDAVEL